MALTGEALNGAVPLNREHRREIQRETSGFKPERTRYRIRGKGDLEGLLVEMKGISVGTFMEVAEMADLDPRNFSAADMPRVKRLFEIVADSLAEWNLLDDEDQPVPATHAGVMSQDFPLVMAIIEGWMEAIGGVPTPLDQPSADGKQSGGLSIPMDVG